MTVRIITGDAREVLKTLPDRSFQMCVTSPPYYALRDYGVAGQIGLEATPDEYVVELVAVFREVHRVLRDDGVLWLNLGDSYCTRPNGPQAGAGGIKVGKKNFVEYRAAHAQRSKVMFEGIKHKDLIGIPWMVAFALRADGWYLRRDIIWSKPNPMPESCTDRPSTAHEYVFLLTKRPQYFYDADAIREPMAAASIERLSQDVASQAGSARANGGAKTNGPMKAVAKKRVSVPSGWDRSPGHGSVHSTGRSSAQYQEAELKSGRNSRSVWTIATHAFAEAHFATFPPALAERCIRAGSSAGGRCYACGAPLERIAEKGAPNLEHQRACGGDADGAYAGQSTKNHAAAGVQDASAVKARILAGMVEKRTIGWRPTCDCQPAPAVPCAILDPFGGSGTVGLVADQLQRDATLIELNPTYAAMARNRIARDAGMFAEVAT